MPQLTPANSQNPQRPVLSEVAEVPALGFFSTGFEIEHTRDLFTCTEITNATRKSTILTREGLWADRQIVEAYQTDDVVGYVTTDGIVDDIDYVTSDVINEIENIMYLFRMVLKIVTIDAIDHVIGDVTGDIFLKAEDIQLKERKAPQRQNLRHSVNCPLQDFWLHYMSMKVTCAKIYLNLSSSFSEYLNDIHSRKEHSLLVSPLVVAGIVIGLVLFLSCVTIIIGSLRKDGCGRDWYLEGEHSYDGISYAASVGDLRSVCTREILPAFQFGSYLELNVSYPDSPPCYDDCVGPGAMEIYLPLDDPPPYSLEDPQFVQDEDYNIIGNRDWNSQESTCHLIPCVPLLWDPIHEAPPPYQTRSALSVHIPLIPMDV
ncbi:protein BEAN1 [Bombina bombina]|uniref:protein BEAN1 n=1 Tax=Bombina bombina TaxID=8345 RepID=UPI00235AAB44|nr:protein BEAN1 [Bombina bombina]